MLKKLFNNKLFIFIFTFTIRAICCYVYGYLTIAGWFIVPDIGLGPVFALMFGPVGALGHSLAMFFFELSIGGDLPSSITDFLITFFISIIAYKLWYTKFNRKSVTTPKFDSTENILKFIKIIFIISICYWSFVNIALKAYPPLGYLYPLTTAINVFSYFLDMFNFGIVFGLLLISLFNILKIPLQTPKNVINRIDIKYSYFAVMFIIMVFYTIMILATSFNNTLVNMVFLLIFLIAAALFVLNKLDTNIESKWTNYSIIEQIILIFLAVLVIVTYVNFDTLTLLIQHLTGSWVTDINFAYMIAIAYGSALVLIFLIYHISRIEKILTNPIYDLISALDAYKKNKEVEENTELSKRLERYSKRDDEISKLVKSFVEMMKSIENHLSEIKKTTIEKERIETEFNVANKIQTHMLKTDFNEFSKDRPFEISAFMNPAKDVGGDFYDYFDIDDEHIGFVIGDVSGKGIPATLFMVKTMYLIRNHSKSHDNLKEFYENVNDLSCQRNEEKLFVTSWFGKLNIKTGKLNFVNSGHEKPLIKEKDKNFEYLDTNPNSVLGLMDGMTYDDHELILNPGDSIFLYTDGITNANNDYEGFFGSDRLKETVNKYENENPKEILEKIKNEVYEYCNNENQFDDMAMLIIRYNGCENSGK